MTGQAVEVVLMTADAAVASDVDLALRSNGRIWTKTTVRTLRELPLHLSRADGTVVVVDLDPHPPAVLADLERVTARFPAVRFVALANVLNNELLLSAMQSGVRHVLLKQSIPADLPGVLGRLLTPAGPLPGERGDVIVVLSASGGCGATTVAVNLAEELATGGRSPAARDRKPLLLVDLDTCYGTLTTYLGVEARYGIDYVLSYDGPTDAHLLSSTATSAGEYLHVLPSPASISFSSPGPMAYDRLEQFLEAATLAYRHVIIDAPRIPMDVAATLVNAGTKTLLVFQLTVKDLRVARSMLAALSERGISHSSIVPVATRYAKRQHMITLEEASTALGDLPVECIRNDYHNAVRAMNFGQTLAIAAPRSILRRDLQDLASRITAASTAPAV